MKSVNVFLYNDNFCSANIDIAQDRKQDDVTKDLFEESDDTPNVSLLGLLNSDKDIILNNNLI